MGEPKVDLSKFGTKQRPRAEALLLVSILFPGANYSQAQMVARWIVNGDPQDGK